MVVRKFADAVLAFYRQRLAEPRAHLRRLRSADQKGAPRPPAGGRIPVANRVSIFLRFRRPP
jgi:hypothetical protein